MTGNVPWRLGQRQSIFSYSDKFLDIDLKHCVPAKGVNEVALVCCMWQLTSLRLRRILLLHTLNLPIFSYTPSFLSSLFSLVPALDQCRFLCLFWNGWHALLALSLCSRIRSMILLSSPAEECTHVLCVFSALYLCWNTVVKLNILDLPTLGRSLLSQRTKMSRDWSVLPLTNCCLSLSSQFTGPHITKMVKVSSARLQSSHCNHKAFKSGLSYINLPAENEVTWGYWSVTLVSELPWLFFFFFASW